VTIEEAIQYAKKRGLHLEPMNFQIVDDAPAIDGMDPQEWIDAMTGEEKVISPLDPRSPVSQAMTTEERDRFAWLIGAAAHLEVEVEEARKVITGYEQEAREIVLAAEARMTD
jgi:hypothetical protein